MVGNTLYFRADDGTNGAELWKSDGTAADTTLVANIYPDSGDSFPVDLTVLGSHLYFNASNGTNGYELWKSDGTEAGTVMVKDINLSGDSNPEDLTVVGSTVYFRGTDGVNGRELWKSDGTAAGTVMVKDINAEDSYPFALTKHGNLIYFIANTSANGYEMYFSDGTEAGTMRIPAPPAIDYVYCDCYENPVRSTALGVFFTYNLIEVGNELGFIPDRLPETNKAGNAFALALLALSGALAAGAVIARRTELRAN
jgi:ELWxxDGT repeat protein